MHKVKLPAVAALSVALAACTVGPDHVRPTLPTPVQFAHVDVSTGAAMPEADAEFWRGFDDPLLTRLVDETLVANHDLRIALARYDRANALLRGARFDQLPTITASAEASDARASDGDRQLRQSAGWAGRRPGFRQALPTLRRRSRPATRSGCFPSSSPR